jgi:hypothetical protein
MDFWTIPQPVYRGGNMGEEGLFHMTRSKSVTEAEKETVLDFKQVVSARSQEAMWATLRRFNIIQNCEKEDYCRTLKQDRQDEPCSFGTLFQWWGKTQ